MWVALFLKLLWVGATGSDDPSATCPSFDSTSYLQVGVRGPSRVANITSGAPLQAVAARYRSSLAVAVAPLIHREPSQKLTGHWPALFPALARLGQVLTVVTYAVAGLGLVYLLLRGLPAKLPRDAKVKEGCSWGLLFFMCLVYASVYFTTDQYIPNLPQMEQDLKGSQAMMSGSVQISLAMKGVFSLVTAPISDRVGRKPILLACSLVMMLGCFMCGCSTNVGWFMAACMLQGMAGSVESVIVAMARDFWPDAAGRLKVIGILECLDFVGSSIAPVFGAVVASCTSWRVPFFIVASAWGLFAWYGFYWLQESSPQFHGSSHNVGRIFGNPSLRILLLTTSCIMGAFFVFNTNSSYILETIFGYSPFVTSLLILGFALLAALGAVLAGKLPQRSILDVARLSCSLFFLAGVFCMALGAFLEGAATYVLGSYLQALTMMMAYCAVQVLYFESLEDCAGLAAACELCSQMVLSGAISAIATFVMVQGGARSFIIFQAGVCTLAGVVFWLGVPFKHLLDADLAPETEKDPDRPVR